jgi:hypothetical protein
VNWHHLGCRGSQTPPRAVAHDRRPDLACRSESDATERRLIRNLRPTGLKNEAGRGPFVSSARDAEEVGTFREAPDLNPHRLRRQALAPFGSACRQYPAATGRCHPGPESVSPLADQHARLIRALHIELRRFMNGPLYKGLGAGSQSRAAPLAAGIRPFASK